MASHVHHPPIDEHGLADDCDRCAELADRPLELDTINFSTAWARMLSVNFNEGEPELRARSATEARLLSLLYTWAVFLERWTPLHPRDLTRQVAA